MNCENLQSDLPLYIDDVLPEGERVLIEKHLPTCPLCRQKLSEYKEIKNSLRVISRPIIPSDLLNSVRSAVANELDQPTIQIGTEVQTSFSEKLAHWILPYSVGTVVASIFTFVLLTVLLTTTDATSDSAKIDQETGKSTILLARSTPGSSNDDLNLSPDYRSVSINDYQPEINPSGALLALSNSIVRGKMNDEEVVIVADVFNNGVARINEIVEPPSNVEAMNTLQQAFDANPDVAPFLPTKNKTTSETVRVILKIQRVDVVDLKSKENSKKQ